MELIRLFLTILSSICWVSYSIPQYLRMRKTKSARDISLLFSTEILIGVASTSALILMTNSSWWVLEQQIVNLLGAIVLEVSVIMYKLKDRKRWKWICEFCYKKDYFKKNYRRKRYTYSNARKAIPGSCSFS